MSLKTVITGLVFTAFSFIAFNANAALMNVGGVEVMVADVDDYGKGGASSGTPPELVSFFSGANIIDTEGGQYEYKVTFLYKQAVFDNVFNAPDGQSIGTDAAENDMIMGTFNVAPGAFLDFSFGANCDASFMNCTEISNGSNVDSETSTSANFAVSEIATDGDVSTFYLFLNDTGSNPDVDYDDLIVFVELTKSGPPSEVPEPSTILLLALGAIGFARYKK
ncbi:PEP-CTERM sorting domain-containing protein [Thalassotalea litorea]|uniref:PEP-CTERM sorting domain-containing protein n=1 Tax=Thalassotalea litorea TaxID=2020715 RepID=A0A5R9IBV5_9GAMM|nr:PEP-CTERM sorting domain-containing protein [Thalassotalea litorea]TLU59473.1 PEP-CTERM sorting domain-containing protein [Thalassotalea litorea]